MDNEIKNDIVENKQYTLTVNTPAGCIVKINNTITNTLKISENQRIEILVSKTGYKSYQQIIDSLTEDTTIDIESLELLKHTIKVITDSENIVLINGCECTELIVDEFTPINILVECNGYISENEYIEKLTEDKIINIQLEKIYHTFKIFIPEDAKINFYPENCAKQIDNYLLVTVDEFIPVNWVITKTGYKNHIVYIEKVTEDKDFESPILEYETFSLTVNAGKNCKNAKLTLNNEKAIFGQTNEIGTIGTEVTIKVEKEHYYTYLQTIILNENRIITVDLEEKKYFVTINNVPSDAIVNYKIGTNKNKRYEKAFEVKAGSQIIITASKPDYKPFIHTIDSLDKDYVIEIPQMELKKYNLTVNAPKGSNIKINGTETKYFPQIFDIHSQIKIEVSKEHYITHIHEFEITEDTVYDCILNLEQYLLTVTSNPENAKIFIINDSEQYTDKEKLFDYGSELLIKAELEGYEPFEKQIRLIQNTTENIVLEKKKVTINFVTEPISILSDALIKINNIQLVGIETKVNYGETYNIIVEKIGYKTFEIEITPIEDTTIYIDNDGKWHKPNLTVSIKNIQDIKNIPVILVNDKPIGNNITIPIDYNTKANIKIFAENYFDIIDDILMIEDYIAEYELVDIHTGKYLVSINTELENAEIFINGKKQHKLYVDPDTEINIEIKHDGYETITDSFIVTENIEKFYNIDLFVKKIFKCKWKVNPLKSIVKINDEEIINKFIEVPYLTEINYSVLCEKYLPKSDNIIITKDTEIKVVLDLDSNYINQDNNEDIYGEGLEGIIRMIKLRSCYSYLYIGKYFNKTIDEESVRKFYEKFGYYVNSRFDYLLWNKMKEYFGDK